MIIDLSDPFTGTIAGGIVLMIVGGTYHYIVTLVAFNKTKEQLGNVLSEMNALHQNYKEEISNIKKRHNKEINDAMAGLDRLENKMDKFLDNNKPLHGFNVLSNEKVNLYNLPKHK